MKSIRNLLVTVMSTLVFSPPSAAGQGPLRVDRQPDRIVLSNDYLERLL